MKSAGALLHISSLKNDYGIGSLGKESYEFVDFLASAGLKYWQVLPLCPTGYGDSPYQSASAFAGNPYFIDLETLIEEGLLENAQKIPFEKVNYEKIYNTRFDILRRAYDKFKLNIPNDYYEFVLKADWLESFAYFMAIKLSHNMQSWQTWSDELKHRNYNKSDYEEDANFFKFMQYEFFKQWHKLKSYANSRGVSLIGDMPIYVALDSADVWENPKMYLLDDNLAPVVVAGVPPDLFSATGQLWGNPIYDWDNMKSNGFSWWKRRINAACENFDAVRIDHFRGFDSYYVIPSGDSDASNGKWLYAPGKELFDTVKREIPSANIIAEDLGDLFESVRELMRYCGYPGMKVLQFAFDGNLMNEYLPKNYTENFLAYTGTHDNNTSLGWFNECNGQAKAIIRKTLEFKGIDIVGKMIAELLSSQANIVIIPMQDFLRIDEQGRMNTPSTCNDKNWSWRMEKLPSRLKIKNLLIKHKRV